MKQTILLIALLAASCTSSRIYYNEPTYVLREMELENGTTVSYSLQSNYHGQPKIRRTQTTTSEIAWLGISVKSIGGSLAEQLGIEPWHGVHVDVVSDDSPVSQAGLRRGDVVLAVDTIEITSRDQFMEVVRTKLTPNQPVDVSIRRFSANGSSELSSIVVVPEGRTVNDTTTDLFLLETSEEIRSRTGLQLATVPSDLSTAIWDDARSAPIVAGVICGSPAYLAGLREGDLVVACNGAPVDALEDVVTSVRSSDEIVLDVDGGLGAHTAGVRLIDDVDSKHSFHIPIVLDYDANVTQKSTSFLDFIFQFGFNYKKRYYSSDTREVLTQSKLSILPFGMFEFESGPYLSKQTYFWLIDFKTRR